MAPRPGILCYVNGMSEPWENQPRPARVVENHLIARGTCWLSLRIEDEWPLPYRAGTITSVLLEVGGRRLRHPYTVSAVDPENREIALLFRVIQGGAMTPVLSQLGAGNLVAIAGAFSTPIATMIRPEATSVVGISTGSGVGPLAGFAREALLDPAWTRPITLLTGFRAESDVPLAPQLEAMEEDPRFVWQLCLSQGSKAWEGPRDRVSAVLPSAVKQLAGAHVHLVGNGAMVNEVRAGLLKAGFPTEFVTSETYFNRTVAPDPQVVQRLADALKGRF
jgi:NAD(P)H-flavin reductase